MLTLKKRCGRRSVALRALIAMVASSASPRLLAQPPRPLRPHATAISHVTIIDVASGRRLADQTVIITGSRITAVGAHLHTPVDTRQIDGTGLFVIPGLWDMHVHAAQSGRAPYYWPLFVAHGVTGVRNMGGYLDSLVYWRSVRDTLRSAAPRIVWSSPIVDGLATYPHAIVARTPEEARAVVDSMRRLRFDEVKVYGHLPRSVYFALADEARRIRMPFAGHVPYRVTPIEAAEAGQRSVEHLENEVEFCTPGLMDANALLDSADVVGFAPPPGVPKRVIQLATEGYDSATCAPVATAFRQHHTWQTPTLVANRAYFSLEDTLAGGDPRRRYEPPSVVAGWDSTRRQMLHRVSAAVVRAQHALYESRTRLTGELSRAHVPILAGTDVADLYGVFPGASVHDELALLVSAGLTPLDALRAATLEPARYLAATDSLGTVAKGKLADLVLLDADPLLDIRNTAHIHAVVTNGRYLDRAMLNALIDAAERRATGAN